MKTMIGSYSLRRQPKKREEGLPQCEWNWVVRFYQAGKEKMRTAPNCPVCSRVLKDGQWVVREGSCLTVADPVKERPNCDCQRAARRWAEATLETETALLQQGELEKLAELRTPTRWDSPAEVLRVYRERGPADRVQRLNYLASIYEQTTGRSIAQLQWEELTGDLLRCWAEMRQEAGRRGWLGLGAGKNMPANGWEVLRGLMAARKLPRLDTTTVAEWNTTIVNYLSSVKSIFGATAREIELRGLNVPPLESFLAVKMRKMLPLPEGHKEIPVAVMERIERELPGLSEREPLTWLFFMICDEAGLRPVSVRRLAAADLLVLDAEAAGEVKRKMARDWGKAEAEICDFGGLLQVGAAKNGDAITTPISAEVVDMALSLREPAAEVERLRSAVLECESKQMGDLAVKRARQRLKRAEGLLGTGVDMAYKRLNAWLRECGVTGNQVSYLLRHRKAQTMRRFGGKSAVALSHGHRSEQMANRYSREDRVVPAVGLRKKAG